MEASNLRFDGTYWLTGADVPLALVVTGAHRHDVSRLEHLLASIIIEHPYSFECPQHICLDAGYAGRPALEIAVVRDFIPRIRDRGQEHTKKAHNPAYKARLRVVEAAHSWMNRFRKIPVRFEKPTVSYMGLLMFACAFIAFRKAAVI